MARTTTTVLVSGGIDSAACLAYHRDRGVAVRGLFVDYGHPANPVELPHARRIAAHYGVPLDIVSCTGPAQFGSGEILGRNLFFVSLAMLYSTPGTTLISLGVHTGTPYFDCSEQFHHSVDRLIQESTNGSCRFDAPFLRMTKGEIYAYALEQGVPVAQTYSCETGAAPPCQRCPSCKDRAVLHAC